MTEHYYAISGPTQMGFVGRREINPPQAVWGTAESREAIADGADVVCKGSF